jgi:hypothetical protein
MVPLESEGPGFQSEPMTISPSFDTFEDGMGEPSVVSDAGMSVPMRIVRRSCHLCSQVAGSKFEQRAAGPASTADLRAPKRSVVPIVIVPAYDEPGRPWTPTYTRL